MDSEDLLPYRSDDPLAQLVREDLDPLSIEELDARVRILEAEIARTRARREGATKFRAAADNLFKS